MTTTKRTFTPKRFAFEDILDASSRYAGFCLACGAERGCCEPDARRYLCEECGLKQVYGAEEIAMMGLILDDE